MSDFCFYFIFKTVYFIKKDISNFDDHHHCQGAPGILHAHVLGKMYIGNHANDVIGLNLNTAVQSEGFRTCTTLYFNDCN